MSIIVKNVLQIEELDYVSAFSRRRRTWRDVYREYRPAWVALMFVHVWFRPNLADMHLGTGFDSFWPDLFWHLVWDCSVLAIAFLGNSSCLFWHAALFWTALFWQLALLGSFGVELSPERTLLKQVGVGLNGFDMTNFAGIDLLNFDYGTLVVPGLNSQGIDGGFAGTSSLGGGRNFNDGFNRNDGGENLPAYNFSAGISQDGGLLAGGATITQGTFGVSSTASLAAVKQSHAFGSSNIQNAPAIVPSPPGVHVVNGQKRKRIADGEGAPAEKKQRKERLDKGKKRGPRKGD
ncbi:hypothetical protein R3P38DRAFT_2775198 [Favolaschia claudopus]|uniref:Transmembrane protein n=1 Tax=Favolaschia claudopus TaxID=2862362 RepID=A0AAW0BSA5_9AGAR